MNMFDVFAIQCVNDLTIDFKVMQTAIFEILLTFVLCIDEKLVCTEN